MAKAAADCRVSRDERINPMNPNRTIFIPARHCLRALLVAATFACTAHNAAAGLVLPSVDWVQRVPAPTGFLDGSWALGGIEGLTVPILPSSQSGAVVSIDWGALAFTAGYGTSVHEGVILSGPGNAESNQSFRFLETIAPPTSVYLFFGYLTPLMRIHIPNSWDSWTLLGASNATYVTDQGLQFMEASPSATQSANDGFLIRIDGETFQYSPPLDFQIFTQSMGDATAAFTMAYGSAAIPEPGTWAAAALLAGGAAFARWRKRR